MTVSSEQSFIEYNGDGATQTFPVPFYFILNSDISVTVADADGNLDELTYGVDFSASGGGNPDGGTATLNTAYASGFTILIYRNPPETQETAYYENGKFPAKSHEKALDKLTMLIQKYGWWFDSLALKKPSYLSDYYDAEGNMISNLAAPLNSSDAATKSYSDSLSNKTLRVPESYVPQYYPVESRANMLVGCNNLGEFVPIAAQTSTADLALQLASSYGATLVHNGSETVADQLNKLLGRTTVSIKDFGAIGDGNNHPLSERYSTLAEAQAVYPFITSLTQTIDFAATQAALNAVFTRGGGAVFIPAATSDAGYKISTRIIVPDKVNIYGEGYMSCLTSTSALASEVVALDWGPYSSGRFLRHFRISGADSSVGLGTTIDGNITQYRYIYGFHIDSVSVQGVDTAFQFQGLWHSKLTNCTSGNCRVGLDLWGQNVSVNVDACHFRQQNVAKLANSYGIRIRPRQYTFQPTPSRSEAIILSNETMCIGFNCGVDLQDGLDIHFSELDLDYCQQFGLLLTNVDGGFSFRDSWIAADVTGTAQFFGVQTFASTSSSPPRKTFDSLYLNCANANPSANNIGINLRNGHNYVTISNSTFNNGNIAVYGINVTNVKVSGNLMGPTCTIDGCQNWTWEDNRMAGLTELNKPAGTFNTYRENTGTPALGGKLLVPMAVSATSGTASIPLGSASLTYLVNKLDRNSAGSADTVSVSGTTVTVNRATPVASAIGTYVEYVAI